MTIAHIDAGFSPHPDFSGAAQADPGVGGCDLRAIRSLQFDSDMRPEWPGDRHEHWQWHALMTTAAAFGNGRLGQSFYRGIASDAELVLVQT